MLFDWKNKYKSLKSGCPNLQFKHVKIIRGGWNIGFIVDNKYVFKIAKFYDETKTINKVTREKRITDAFRNAVKIKVPKIVIIKTPKFVFYRYDFIAGKNLNHLPARIIKRYCNRFASEIAQFIYAVHNTTPAEINDLKVSDGDGWNHNDICNNMIVDTKSHKIVGIIDWEYAGYGTLETEFNNCVRFSSRLRKSDILDSIKSEYQKLQHK
ncbi:MAG: phosphotransferase [Alphaproteobacteria bacterium]|nr:phosphotransferase [Alphaproteobacteria bacterium]